MVLLVLDADRDNLILKSYVYANGEVLMQHNGNHTADKFFYLHDRLGSVRFIINENAAICNGYKYKPFGEFLGLQYEVVSNPFLFIGQWFDPEIGQYYLRARQYDPMLFRFTSRDPVSGQFEEPMTLHKYLYCGNNPINYIDPDGRWALSLGVSLSAFTNLSACGLFGEGSLASSMVGYNSIVLPYFLAVLEEDFGAGGTGGANFTVAHDQTKTLNEGWSWGFLGFYAAGAAFTESLNASATIDIGFSPQAKNVKDLIGPFVEGGLSVVIPPTFLGINDVGFHASAELGPDNLPNGIYLYTGSFGWGFGSPVETHAFVGNTRLLRKDWYWESNP